MYQFDVHSFVEFECILRNFQCEYDFYPCIFCYFQELRSQFDNCLADGQPLLVTDIDVNVFKNDPRFGKVILSRTQFTVGKNPFKIPVRVVALLCC